MHSMSAAVCIRMLFVCAVVHSEEKMQSFAWRAEVNMANDTVQIIEVCVSARWRARGGGSWQAALPHTETRPVLSRTANPNLWDLHSALILRTAITPSFF